MVNEEKGYCRCTFFLVYKHGLNSQITINQVQSPTKTPFSNVDLVWIHGVKHEGENKVSNKIMHITHAHVSKFLEGEQGDVETPMEWNTHKNCPHKKV